MPTPEVRLEAFDAELHSQRLGAWLRRPHVARWWGDPRQVEDSLRRSGETRAVIVADGDPVGFLCWQTLPRDELEAAGLSDLPEGLVDVDVLIGEPEVLGCGIGPSALGLLLARLRVDPSVSVAGVGTSVANVRALRAFEKAGFRRFREFQDPEFGACRYLVLEVGKTD
jgi:RimJ/RimL family protein N-acetyltransferase